jgi:hypothetical protein
MTTRRIAYLSAVLFAILPSAFGFDTWTFNGIVTTGLPGSPYRAGLPYAASFTIDTSRLATTPTGLYFPTLGYGFGVNHSGFGASSVGSGVLVANDRPGSGGGSFDGIIFSFFGEQSSGFSASTPFDGSADGITLVNTSGGPTATPFIGTSFPSTLDLNQFSQRYLDVPFQGGSVLGTVDSLTINGVLVSQTPEPSVLGLLVLGGLLFGLPAFINRRNKTA